MVNFEKGSHFENSSRKEKEDLESFDEIYNKPMSRRDFLGHAKRILGVAAGAYLGYKAGKPVYEMGKELGQIEDSEIAEKEDLIEETPTSEQVEISEENTKSLIELLKISPGEKIKIDAELIEKVKQYWKHKYSQDEKYRTGFIEGYKNMGEWLPYIESIFKEEGVPLKFLYLAIPESHWKIDAVSKAGAVGPYQFMRLTGLDYHLKINQSIDERKDPIKSARACARLLRDRYGISNDWDLALSDYNGGFSRKYILRSKEQGTKSTYENFLKDTENNFNIIKESLEKKHFYYKVMSGDNLYSIAKKIKTNQKTLKELNNLTNDLIRVGDNLRVPGDLNLFRADFFKEIKGYHENLNYPAKFNAIWELIEEGFVRKEIQRSPVRFEVKKVKAEGPNFKIHIAKSGEGLMAIARIYKIDYLKIAEANKNIKPPKYEIEENYKLKIPLKGSAPATIANLARGSKEKLLRLQKLNPAIQSSRTPIPNNYLIRV